MPRVKWKVKKLTRGRGYKGYIDLPTYSGLPIQLSTQAYTPLAAKNRTLAAARTLNKAPGIEQILPPQARLALMAARTLGKTKFGKRAKKWLKNIF